jgi:hypothetical protein
MVLIWGFQRREGQGIGIAPPRWNCVTALEIPGPAL